jgi:superfamily II DNA or RNA helicase
VKLPPGLYESLVTRGFARALEDLKATFDAGRTPMSDETAAQLLARAVHDAALKALRAARGGDAGEVDQSEEENDVGKRGRQIALTNALLDVIAHADGARSDEGSIVMGDDYVNVDADLLVSLQLKTETRLGSGALVRPSLPLRHSDLIVNGPRDLRLGNELRREIASADRIDVIVSFVKWTGLRVVLPELREFAARRPGALRFITTTYMGASEARAIEELLTLGAQVKISYDARRTRLHAKAWLFHRDSGFSTALVGSSNLSHAAMHDGCEWNVRLSSIDNAAVLEKFSVTFAQYWNDEAFEAYDAARFRDASLHRDPQRDALARAVALRALPHQQAVLDALAAERSHGHNKNLVVAATGTGKTVVAALDYARLRTTLHAPAAEASLLFVAHRDEILQQSLATFRAAVRDGHFGELLVGKHKPVVGRHVFASIQSLHAERLGTLAPDAYDVVIVDEFHHAAAQSYDALLAHLRPKILLGLTATPERSDGQSILGVFDGRVAAELRLWDALDQGLLAPFQYFGLHDATDLSSVDFRAGRYDVKSLDRLYTGDHVRAQRVLRAVAEKVPDPLRMRAIGFCVSVAHAQFMAAFFTQKGIPSLAIDANTDDLDRRAALEKLCRGEVNVVFAVDLLNEGVDVPAVDTVLFLRPTESATVFLQQLGRGLRLEENKSCLTVLDFIGGAHRAFRFVDRFRALVPGTRASVAHAIEEGFPHLPAGCDIRLDRETQAAVLSNVRASITTNWNAMADDLRAVGDVPLKTFLDEAGLELDDLYRKNRSYAALRHAAGHSAAPTPHETLKALPRMLHIDDDARLSKWSGWLLAKDPPAIDRQDPHFLMFVAALGLGRVAIKDVAAPMADLWEHASLRSELLALLELLKDRSRRTSWEIPRSPFRVHARYSRDEVSAGLLELRKDKIMRTQGGVYCAKAAGADVFFVELDKDPSNYTPTTLYNDYPISSTQFHWESQSKTRAQSETGRRYLASTPLHWRKFLFVRHTKEDDRKMTNPYTFLGPVRYVSHEGERPLRITWELERAMPPDLFANWKIAAG